MKARAALCPDSDKFERVDGALDGGRSNGLVKQGGAQKLVTMGEWRNLTAARRRRNDEAVRRRGGGGGFCEICNQKFEDLKKVS